MVDELQFSIQFLEDTVSYAEKCEGFVFYVSASVSGVEDSGPAVVKDTLPLCKWVVLIAMSLFGFGTVRVSP